MIFNPAAGLYAVTGGRRRFSKNKKKKNLFDNEDSIDEANKHDIDHPTYPYLDEIFLDIEEIL